ncbi:DUF3656 domain-containing U32 family peptidase [Geosporobacter ferrireducens]|uniref:DUF3656 domain-containing U32 family peptidase n=1 Tax=Geosporobacter ferrireducens TaxID=1424294 RepID=UPI00139E0E96|nr:U32 family peptidase [Geosporobacter ferrireducens]MTI56461.1 U32 family peptidase [Geosporobacter ferrireducens]
MNQVELLAPVGSWEALEAAVQNGANAVYLGGKAFNARQSAGNFDEEELKKAIAYCHIRGVQVFITVNTLIGDEEFEELGKYITFLYNHDADAIIVQDLGVAKLVRDFFPDFELHASTQMSVHNREGVELLAGLGFKRVVLAREMPVDEIRQIAESTNVDLEVFVHGALCVSYSGQCLMSSMIGGRSGNRGRCAQTCRMPYTLVNMKNGQQIKNDFGEYLLSPRDLNTLEHVDKLLAAGVKSLKIEGRMKRPEYVATIVGAYRKAIDQFCEKGIQPKLDQRLKIDVAQIFNRKFTKGYLFGDWGHKLMSFEKPSNRGIYIGETLGYDRNKRRLKLQLSESLAKGDGIEIWAREGDNSGAIVEAIFNNGNKSDQGQKGDIIEIPFKTQVQGKLPVYKTTDLSLLKRAKESYERREKCIPVYGRLKGVIGETLILDLWDDENHYVQQESEYVVERALKTATGEVRIHEQMAKLGGTVYELAHLEMTVDSDAVIPIGELNRLRREVVGKMDRAREKYHDRRHRKLQQSDIKLWIGNKNNKAEALLKLNVSVSNMEQLEAALKYKVDRIYYREFPTMKKAIAMARDHGISLVPAFSRITREEEMHSIRSFVESYGQDQPIMVSNLGILEVAKRFKQQRIYTDYFLNIFNSGSVKLLQELGVQEITLSPELTLKQIRRILDNCAVSYELVVQGYLMLMVMEHCPVEAVMNPKQKEGNCSRCRNNQFGLKDRLGKVFPIMTDASCRTHLLNAQKLCLLGHLSELAEAGITNFRLDFTIEDSEEVEQTIKAYRETLDNLMKQQGILGKTAVTFLEKIRQQGLTKGHFFRGVE